MIVVLQEEALQEMREACGDSMLQCVPCRSLRGALSLTNSSDQMAILYILCKYIDHEREPYSLLCVPQQSYSFLL